MARRSRRDRLTQSGTTLIVGLLLGIIGIPPATNGMQINLPVLVTQNSPNEQKRLAEDLFKQGIEQYKTNQFEAALQSWQQALTRYQQLQDSLGEGIVLGNLGLAYYALGNYAKAIDYQQQRLAIAREIQDRLGEGYALGNLGNAYYALGDYAQAVEYHQQLLTIAREIKDRKGEGAALGHLGSAYHALGDYGRASEYQQQRLAITREIHDRRGEGAALGNLGNAYYALGNYAKAIDYQKQRLMIAQETQDRLGTGESLNNLGLALFGSGKLAEAEGVLLSSIEVFESLRNQLSDAERVSIADTQQQAYNNLQQVLIAQNKVMQALEISERGRARAFVQLLTSRLNNQISNQLPNVASLTLEQMRQVARDQRATLVSYSIVYNEQLLIWVIQPTGEIAFRLVDLKQLQQQQTSLDQLIALARCFEVPICKQKVQLQRTVLRDNVKPTVGRIIFNQELAEKLTSTIPTLNHLYLHPYLQQLHQLLIAPIADLLPQDPKAQVVFIPQGSLFLVPFAALQDTQGKYLIEHHTIRIAPAIQVLQLTQQQQQKVRQAGLQRILVVGNPTMPKLVLKPGEPAQVLPSLPGAEKEARAIAPLLGTKALIGEQATKATVIQEMAKARIIHLATHGKADDQQGLQSWIALAPSAQDSGFLTADEILNLKLQAELVVLSACQTGQGRITGDGVIGLSRSLISAGVPTVLVSLWEVPDAPTSYLMTQFYRNLKSNPDKAQALRQAMLKTRERNPNPIAWAAFILIGEAS